MPEIILNGITWGHSRGITPLQAVSQRFCELHPQVQINWHKRSLQEFADFPIEQLTQQYDLLIIDHPWVGTAAALNCVLPLDQYLDDAYLANQAANSVGMSHLSYYYQGHQWALAIDAATPAASYRADLMFKNNCQPPTTWNELLALAKKGKVAVPSIPIDCLMMFYSFCIAQGNDPFVNNKEVIDRTTGLNALASMAELYALLDDKMFNLNPIAVAELMTSTNDYWYCPFAYCYSNYARPGYAKHPLKYTDTISFGNQPLRTTIGGTGIAVSAFSNHPQLAVAFAAMAVSEICQSTLYVQHGGQPGHLAAWNNDLANQITNGFFNELLPLMERGYTRPRYHGYLQFQDHAGLPLQTFLKGKLTANATLDLMNEQYAKSLVVENSTVAL